MRLSAGSELVLILADWVPDTAVPFGIVTRKPPPVHDDDVAAWDGAATAETRVVTPSAAVAAAVATRFRVGRDRAKCMGGEPFEGDCRCLRRLDPNCAGSTPMSAIALWWSVSRSTRPSPKNEAAAGVSGHQRLQAYSTLSA